jgi:glycerol kinase
MVLAIDQGTTSSRAILFDRAGASCGTGQRPLKQFFPKDGWVEHDPELIWQDTVASCRDALSAAGIEPADIAAIGITNQRETAVLWDRASGKPLHNAIVWQDRRTAPLCRRLVEDGHEDLVRERTGLVVDAYFSATKLAWLLDHVPGARAAAERGELAFGTVDSFLVWRLTGGSRHVTDATNASRTMLFDIARQRWDDDLLALLRIPRALLPEVLDSAAEFGATDAELFGRAIPVTGIAGDQQAATVGQACFAPGMIKSTYGTGCFALLNTGPTVVPSPSRLLGTVAYRLDGATTYALEGSIFIAGAAVQWLRDQLGLIEDAAETQALAESVPDSGGAYLVPAFTGLGAPYWDPDARAGLLGLNRDTSKAQVVRATLEAVAFETRDLIEAMAADLRAAGSTTKVAMPSAVRVDGGMVVNDFVCQALADILDLPVERPRVVETTALGAAILAGLQAGVFDSIEAATRAWQLDRHFEPRLSADRREALYAGWRRAVRRVRGDG